MLKLMKYEFRKQLFSKIIIIAMLTALEIAFLIACIISDRTIIVVSNALIQYAAFFVWIYLLIEPLSVYENDLGKKQGYSLFMTPSSSFRIVGMKLLSGMLQLVISFLILIGIIMMNQIIFVQKYGYKMVNQLETTFNSYNDPGFSIREFIVTIIFIIAFSIFLYSIGFITTSIAYTFLSKGKLNSFISFILFFVLLIVELIVVGMTLIPVMDNMKSNNSITVWTNMLIIMFIPTIINYIGTCKLLDTKISL